jgi:hypothetical protein
VEVEERVEVDEPVPVEVPEAWEVEVWAVVEEVNSYLGSRAKSRKILIKTKKE